MTSFHRGTDACLLQARDGAAAAYDAGEADLDLYLRRLFLPLGRDGEEPIVATADPGAENVAWLGAAYPGARLVFVPRPQLIAEIRRRFDRRLTQDAIFALARETPALSAQRVVTRGQTIALGGFAAAVVVAAWRAPLAVLGALVALMSLIFTVSVLFRAMLAWLGALPKNPGTPAAQPGAADSTLPPYTIMVPLYREARVLPTLVRALRALDYPADRLQILLVVEADDLETAAAAEAMGGPFDVVRVPPSLPRTKPKAANFALRLARGEFVVIFDAEDRPEPDQLRKAVAAFRRRPRTTACLQARLAFFNCNENWLTKLFALDYDLWFGVFLPGLDRIGVPMPLGGTSNHFRTSVLRAIHAWDPFNVTEDADLGLRLAQLGYRVSMLDSTTHEEAPARLDVWIRQRSRWLKGYMQTWLVHGRSAPAVIGRVGLGGFLAFQLFIGGAVLSALVNPLLWAIFLASSLFPLPIFGGGHDLAYVSAAGVIGSNGVLTWLAVIGSKWRGDSRLAPYGLTVAVYWILISIAGYRGFWHLLTKPFHWEKTDHGLSGHGADAGHA